MVLVEVGSSEDGPGPYITRVHGGEGRNSVGPVSLPHNTSRRSREPFSGILATAGNNISQAESILSSLGHQRLGTSDSEEEDPTSLGNIKTLKDINVTKPTRFFRI